MTVAPFYRAKCYGPVSVCLSVCLSVWGPYAGILSKRLHASPYSQCRTV